MTDPEVTSEWVKRSACSRRAWSDLAGETDGLGVGPFRDEVVPEEGDEWESAVQLVIGFQNIATRLVLQLAKALHLAPAEVLENLGQWAELLATPGPWLDDPPTTSSVSPQPPRRGWSGGRRP
jgi:hypothetical protein